MDESTRTPARGRMRWPFAAVAAAFFLVLTLGMFGEVLLSRTTMVSATGEDQTTYGLGLREYGFGALAKGRLPLWNPYVFAGTPYLSNIQTGLFYPPNWVRLVTSTVTGLNVSVALHFFLAGWFTAMWAHARTRSAIASLLAGVVYACSGGYFLHLYPGHDTILAAGAWSPAFFLCMERLLGTGGVEVAKTRRERTRWAVWTAVVVAMSALAGHPQVPYYTWVAAGVYALADIASWRRDWRRVVTLLVAGALGFALAAVQLAPTWELTGASTRTGGMTAEGMRQQALPVENLLTLVMAHPFGPPGRYVGRWMPWEVSIFAGAVTVVLAAYAGVTSPPARRLLAAAAFALLLTGVEPISQGVARVALPGYASFRGAGRFGIVVDLLLAVAAADGLATMVARGRPAKGAAIGSAAAGTLLLAAAAWLAASPESWRVALRALDQTGRSLVPHGMYQKDAFVHESLRNAWVQAAATGAIFVAAAAILGLWRWRGERHAARWAAALAVLAAGEMLAVARSDRATGPTDWGYPQAWVDAVRQARAASLDGGRVATLTLGWSNYGVRYGYCDALGYDSTLLARYAKYLAVSQGLDWSKLDFTPPITHGSQMFDALRVRAALFIRNDQPTVIPVESAFPRFVWMHAYERCDGLDAVLSRLGPAVNLRETVLLEGKPSIEPAPGVDGTVRVVRQTPEEIEVEATTPAPAILLMTDAYAPGWRVRSVEKGPQEAYELLPADAALRAIPLAAGSHHFVVSYTVPGLLAGAWVSGVTLVGLAAALVVGSRPLGRRR